MINKKFYLKVKKLKENAKIDPPAKFGDAGYDCYSVDSTFIPPHKTLTLGLGISIEFPMGYVCIINQKSGLSSRTGLDTIANVIDSGYRGELHAILVNTSDVGVMIEKGQKVCQLLFFQCFTTKKIQFTKILTNTERSDKGFGSTGR